MDKKLVVVLFGGQSSEHEVSCVSALTVIENMNTDVYDTILIGITKDGRWLKTDAVEDIVSGEWRNGKVTAVISPDRGQQAVLFIQGSTVETVKIDVVFPVLHGLYGEDGTVQGLFELAGIPYVGSGVLSSAVSMDKLITKQIVNNLEVRQAKFVSIFKQELTDMRSVVSKIEEKLSYPVFVKPATAGSSRGITKAHNQQELIDGLNAASAHDKKLLVEETIVGREIECAVLGGNEPKASGVGEILSAAEFYDYDAKYHNTKSQTVISPELPDGKLQEISETAVRIFRAVDGYGLARVDFFLEQGTNEVVFNEINTMPGFTSISMYSMLWEAKGISKARLVEKLLQLALTRVQV